MGQSWRAVSAGGPKRTTAKWWRLRGLGIGDACRLLPGDLAPFQETARPVTDVEHVHGAQLFVDTEQHPVVSERELPEPHPEHLLLESQPAAVREEGQALHGLEELANPPLRGCRRFASDPLVERLNVRQCPWRQADPVAGTSPVVAA